MVPSKGEKGVVLVCKKCDITEKVEGEIKLKTTIKNVDRQETVVVANKEELIDGVEEKECPSCHQIAKFIQWQVQTRSADEAPTTFYKCSKCNHTWRDYGG